MDDTTLAAAFLHDVVEDTDVTLDQLTDIFGLEVAGTRRWRHQTRQD